ncbi:MAG: cellulase family glycosylhydrolase [Draconibacterium sp.]|nr:cellulase family glycosylhydrolase [Draconibacterium sp.]
MKQLFTVILYILTFSVFAQNREHAFEVNKRLGRGINYGNMFEAPSETGWGNPWKPQYAKMIADLGFNHVRIPIRWEPGNRSSATAPYTISATFLNRIKQVVDSALNNNLHAIINMHHHEALLANPDGQKARFLAQWKQISAFFKDYPDSLLFEILNEPNGNITADKWNIFAADALTEIRKDNPDRIVVIGTPDWGGLGGLPYLKIPDDENIILTVHYYSPFQFTHQGAEWVGNGTEANAWLGTKWNDTETEREIVQNEFSPLIQLEKLKNVPVHIGEFGAYYKADETSRKKWTTYMSRYFDSLGWSWAYWEFSAGFGIYNPSRNTWNQYLVDALLNNELPEPARYVGTPVYTSNFRTSNDGWNLYGQSTAASQLNRADNSLNVNITNGGTEGWHVQLVKNNFQLKAGKKYRFSFKAKSDATRSLGAYIGMSVDPWSSYSGFNSVTTTDTFKVFTSVFDQTKNDNTARMVFDLGKSTAGFTVTELKLEEVVLQWPTSTETIKDFKTTVYPNPATDLVYINNLDNFQEYSILNMQGEVVKSGNLNSYKNQINIETYSPGMYFILLKNGHNRHAVKLLKK